MADISKIKLNNEVYDVKDIVARNMIAGEGRRYVVISDSYGTGRGGQIAWTSYLSALLEAGQDEYYTYSAGSIGIYHVGDGGYNAQTLLEAHSNDISNHDTITDIIFGLGLNDSNDSEGNVHRAFANLATYLRSEYPNARVWVAWIGNSLSLNVYNLAKMIGIYVKNCSEYNFKWCDGVQYIMHNRKFFITDNVHPTSDGCEEIAKGVNAIVRGKDYRYCTSNQATITTYSGGVFNYNEIIDGDICAVNFSNVSGSGVMQFTGSAYAQFGSLSDNILAGRGAITGVVTIFSNDTSAPAVMNSLLSSDKLSLQWAKSGAHSVNGLQVNGFGITMPTIMS